MLENFVRNGRWQFHRTEMIKQFDVTNKLAINVGFVGYGTNDITGTHAVFFTHFNTVSLVIAFHFTALTWTALATLSAFRTI